MICTHGLTPARISTICITNRNWKDRLALHGIFPRKTFINRWPNNIPNNLYKDFIRGYFDGDGTLGKYQHSKTNPNIKLLITPATITSNLLIQDLLHNL